MIKILVTGGAGYIGSILVQDLLLKGYHVTVLDNFMYKKPSLNHLCFNDNLNIIKGDARSKEHLIPLLKNADLIIPLAAFVGAPLCSLDEIGASLINKDAVKLLLRNISNNQKIIMPTTNSAYGSGDKNNFCTEESILNPISKYAIDKVEIEKDLMNRENSISFRLATVFGMSPRMRLDLLVNNFVYRAVNDKFIVLFEGHFKRNYIHIRDVSSAFQHGIEHFDKMKGNIYNVGLSEANYSKIELCQIIKKIIVDFTYIEQKIGKDPDQRNYIVSNKKIEKTGYKALITIEKGITELIKGFKFLKENEYSNI